MKTFLLPIIAVVSIVSFLKCTKNNSSGSTQSEWTINGVTFKVDSASLMYNPSSNSSPYLLESRDAMGNYVFIYFNTSPLNISYNTLAAHPSISHNQDSTCFVYIGVGAQSNGYYTTENPGNKVNVTVINGKVRATFSKIEVVADNSNNPQTSTASGTIIEQ